MLLGFFITSPFPTPPHHPLTPGVDGGLGAVGQVEFVEDIADVAFDGFIADDQAFGNVGVAQAVGDEVSVRPCK